MKTTIALPKGFKKFKKKYNVSDEYNIGNKKDKIEWIEFEQKINELYFDSLEGENIYLLSGSESNELSIFLEIPLSEVLIQLFKFNTIENIKKYLSKSIKEFKKNEKDWNEIVELLKSEVEK